MMVQMSSIPVFNYSNIIGRGRDIVGEGRKRGKKECSGVKDTEEKGRRSAAE